MEQYLGEIVKDAAGFCSSGMSLAIVSINALHLYRNLKLLILIKHYLMQQRKK